MGYQAVYLVEHGYREDSYRFVSVDMNGKVCPERRDGLQTRRCLAEAVYLYRRRPDDSGFEEVLHCAGAPVDVLITDCRVTLQVMGYQKGHFEDHTETVVLRKNREDSNGIRDPEDPGDARSLSLAGMIRYEWISQISFQRKISRTTEECLRLYYRDLEKALWHIDLVFQRADAGVLANDVLHRSCRYRLAMTDEKNDKELYFFSRYRSEDEIEPAADPRRYMSSIRIPTQYPAPGGRDVRPGL